MDTIPVSVDKRYYGRVHAMPFSPSPSDHKRQPKISFLDKHCRIILPYNCANMYCIISIYEQVRRFEICVFCGPTAED